MRSLKNRLASRSRIDRGFQRGIPSAVPTSIAGSAVCCGEHCRISGRTGQGELYSAAAIRVSGPHDTMTGASGFKVGQRSLLVFALLMALRGTARAQTVQLWPEVSAFIKMTDSTRLYLLATTVKEDSETTSGEFGPNLDIYVRPIGTRKYWAGFRLDESKNRKLLVRIGYRYLHNAGDDPEENRGVLEVTPRFPLVRGVLVSNRNRIDFRFIEGEYSWRYRNRLSLEREVSIGRLRVNPYARAEAFYDSRVHAWSRTEFVAGASFPGNWWELEGYYDYQHDTGSGFSRNVHAIGAVLNIYVR